MRKAARETVMLLAVASTMGLSLVLATVIGLAVGYYLDEWLGTSPWLTLTFLLLGIVAGFKNIFVILKRVQRMSGEGK